MCAKLFAILILSATGTLPVAAQSLPGEPNQGRDCQTIRTCNFARGASVRGCLSSYTCRTCRFVTANCSIGNAQGPCQRVKCSWGG